MDKDQIREEVSTIFTETLENDSVVLKDDTTADEVEGWDSLTHVLLVVSIEKRFKIRFTAREIQGWNNVGEMIDSIDKKLKG